MSLLIRSFNYSLRRGALMLLLIALAAATSMVFAQQGDRILAPGTPTAGELTDENTIQVYTFVLARAADASLEITADDGLILSTVITDANAQQVAQSIDIARSGVIGYNQLSLEAGTYYLTIFPTPGADTALTGGFEVLFRSTGAATATDATDTDATDEPASTDEAGSTDEAATDEPAATNEADSSLPARTFPPQEILANGIEVSLSWPTTSDLNLQVRDPVGRNLFFDSTTTDNGGSFGFDVNGLCEILIGEGETATETAQWSAGPVATGSYEVMVYYRQDCENVGPVAFEVNVTVNGVPMDPVQATIQAPIGNTSNVYLTSFIIDVDGDTAPGPQGPYPDTRVLPEPAQTYLEADAPLLSPNSAVISTITSDQYYEMYTVDLAASEPVTISLTAQNGNLDTLLLIFDQNGNIVADNDDIVSAENTNSSINLNVPVGGTYYVMATRYGKDVGGTEGEYEILLSGVTIETPQEITALSLPRGEIEVLLTWNTNADIQLLVRDPIGQSVYDDNRTVSSGGILQATGNINCTVSPTTPPAYYTYWPVAQAGAYEVDIWYQNTCNDPTPVTANLFISVRGEPVLQTQIPNFIPDTHYVLGFEIDPQMNVSVYQGGFLGGLETIDLSSEDTVPVPAGGAVRGYIGQENNFDLWTFEGSAGDVVTISMVRQGAESLDPMLYLVGPNGFELASNDDATSDTKNAQITSLALTADGTYTIVATAYATIYSGTRGNYALTVQFE